MTTDPEVPFGLWVAKDATRWAVFHDPYNQLLTAGHESEREATYAAAALGRIVTWSLAIDIMGADPDAWGKDPARVLAALDLAAAQRAVSQVQTRFERFRCGWDKPALTTKRTAVPGLILERRDLGAYKAWTVAHGGSRLAIVHDVASERRARTLLPFLAALDVNWNEPAYVHGSDRALRVKLGDLTARDLADGAHGDEAGLAGVDPADWAARR